MTHLSTTFDRKWFSKKSSDSAALTWRCPDRLLSNRVEYHRYTFSNCRKRLRKKTRKKWLSRSSEHFKVEIHAGHEWYGFCYSSMRSSKKKSKRSTSTTPWHSHQYEPLVGRPHATPSKTWWFWWFWCWFNFSTWHCWCQVTLNSAQETAKRGKASTARMRRSKPWPTTSIKHPHPYLYISISLSQTWFLSKKRSFRWLISIFEFNMLGRVTMSWALMMLSRNLFSSFTRSTWKVHLPMPGPRKEKGTVESEASTGRHKHVQQSWPCMLVYIVCLNPQFSRQMPRPPLPLLLPKLALAWQPQPSQQRQLHPGPAKPSRMIGQGERESDGRRLYKTFECCSTRVNEDLWLEESFWVNDKNSLTDLV